MEAEVTTSERRAGRLGRKLRPGRLGPRLLGLLLLTTLLSSLSADSVDAAPAHGSAGLNAGALRLAVERLRVLGRVLYVAAHPDDENTFVLAWLVGERRVRTAYLSLTRGGGGQNLVGSERGALVALLRTQELLGARAIDGAEQLFSRARDFGYSKSAAETLRFWDEKKVLGDVVWALRSYRPDVIITRFAGDGSGRHGHHTASAKLTLEAFKLAADAQAYPEQLAHVKPWQAKRVFWNTYHWRRVAADKLRGALPVDVGGYNPLLGVSYGEIAARSRTMHKSQGFGVPARRGKQIERFKLLAGAPAKSDLLEGVELSWKRVRGGMQVDGELKRALRQLKPDAPERAIVALAQAGRAMQALPAHRDKADKLAELGQVIADCAGLFVQARAKQPTVVAGGKLPIELRVLSQRDGGLTLSQVRFADGKTLRPRASLDGARDRRYRHVISVPAQAKASQPYWLDKPPALGSYAIDNVAPDVRGKPEAPPPFAVELTFSAAGHRFRLTRPVVYSWTDRVRGERARPVQIAPAAMVDPERRILLFANGAAQKLAVRVKAGRDRLQGHLELELPAGWRATPTTLPFRLGKAGDELRGSFTIKPPRGADAAKTPTTEQQATVVAVVGKRRYTLGLKQIDHDHIPLQTLFPPATVRLVPLTLRLGGRRIAYLPGAGDEVAESLEQVGYKVTRLRVDELTPARLAAFDALVLGIRALNTHPELSHRHGELMAYVRAGGRVLMQYNTSNRWRRLKGPIGPYPLTISSGRITDEHAALEPIGKRHRVLDGPNKLTAQDFAGWVQERGLYFAKSWDARYRAVLRGHDPGAKPLDGALLVARHGKGAFIYTGLSFFRQLPAGVAGAYRLFANLLAR